MKTTGHGTLGIIIPGCPEPQKWKGEITILADKVVECVVHKSNPNESGTTTLTVDLCNCIIYWAD